eukprot:1858446-Amphidinium_carterae.2
MRHACTARECKTQKQCHFDRVLSADSQSLCASQNPDHQRSSLDPIPLRNAFVHFSIARGQSGEKLGLDLLDTCSQSREACSVEVTDASGECPARIA